MKQKIIALSKRYLTNLRKHLQQGTRSSLQPAAKLGRQAVVLGVETLELARMHKGAIGLLKLSGDKDELIRRAQFFFTEVAAPIGATQQIAPQNKFHLSRLNRTLQRRTAELTATNRQLQRDVRRRKNGEAALKKSGRHYAGLLTESLKLQEGLRQLAHQLLAAQEDERKKIRSELQEEIAQTLLGINVRLLFLKNGGGGTGRKLKNEIASTQRLVIKSARSLRRLARQIGNS
jgi:signal transduction histidine kinase